MCTYILFWIAYWIVLNIVKRKPGLGCNGVCVNSYLAEWFLVKCSLSTVLSDIYSLTILMCYYKLLAGVLLAIQYVLCHMLTFLYPLLIMNNTSVYIIGVHLGLAVNYETVLLLILYRALESVVSKDFSLHVTKIARAFFILHMQSS